MPQTLQIRSPAPVLNTPDFSFVFGGTDGASIPTNEKGHPHFFEFVAMPGTVCTVLETCSEWILRVAIAQYPSEQLFIDRRFTAPAQPAPPLLMPPKSEILNRMKGLLGTPYVWGGNWSRGIPELLHLYPPKGPVDARTRKLWTLSGIDCSGLLFEATGGATPRNTSELIHFGKGLTCNRLNKEEILQILEPLDMILYHGHVLFVLDDQTLIESKAPYGVILRNLKERLSEICAEKRGVDAWDPSSPSGSQFVLRRFV